MIRRWRPQLFGSLVLTIHGGLIARTFTEPIHCPARCFAILSCPVSKWVCFWPDLRSRFVMRCLSALTSLWVRPGALTVVFIAG